MHFIGMLALILPVAVRYDLSLTALSFLIPIVFAGARWRIVNGRRRYPSLATEQGDATN
jgi:NO-binding membrane sensor protein with MHYT domain